MIENQERNFNPKKPEAQRGHEWPCEALFDLLVYTFHTRHTVQFGCHPVDAVFEHESPVPLDL